MAEREGKYLVELFNRIGKQDAGKAFSAKDIPLGEQFVYKHLGSMATVGGYKALVDLRQSKVDFLCLYAEGQCAFPPSTFIVLFYQAFSLTC